MRQDLVINLIKKKHNMSIVKIFALHFTNSKKCTKYQLNFRQNTTGLHFQPNSCKRIKKHNMSMVKILVPHFKNAKKCTKYQVIFGWNTTELQPDNSKRSQIVSILVTGVPEGPLTSSRNRKRYHNHRKIKYKTWSCFFFIVFSFLNSTAIWFDLI